MTRPEESRIFSRNVFCREGENLPRFAGDGRRIMGPSLESNGAVRVFRHDSVSKRLMAVMKNKIVLLYVENGEFIVDSAEREIVDGIEFQQACISQDYILLAGQGRVSVLRWENREASARAYYPQSVPHHGARVLLDKNNPPVSTLLYDKNGFEIYRFDGSDTRKGKSFASGEQVPSVQYLRRPKSDADSESGVSQSRLSERNDGILCGLGRAPAEDRARRSRMGRRRDV